MWDYLYLYGRLSVKGYLHMRQGAGDESGMSNTISCLKIQLIATLYQEHKSGPPPKQLHHAIGTSPEGLISLLYMQYQPSFYV